VSGGQDPQTADDVRTAAPASVVTFGRAISATDYEQVAAQATGVNRAVAAQRTPVTVYVGGDPAAVAAVNMALAGTGDPNRRVMVAAANAIELTLSGTLVLAPGQSGSAVQKAAQEALASLFSAGSMGIGQRLYRSALDAALMVPGVIAVHHLRVTGAGRTLSEVLDPGPGAYFDLPAGQIDIKAVSADV